MITIKNPKTEALIGEILKRTPYTDPLIYLEDRIKKDYDQLKKGKSIK